MYQQSPIVRGLLTACQCPLSDILTSNSLWLAVEANIATIAACLPTLGAFAKGRFKTRALGSEQSTSSQRYLAKRQARLVGSKSMIEGAWIPMVDSSSTVTMAKAMSGKKSNETEQCGMLVERSFAPEMAQA